MNLRRGSNGTVVEQVQQRLKELKLYTGPIDGSYGGGTESAVKTFQKTKGLTPDGCVGNITWGKLFPQIAPPESDIVSKPLAFRCLALSGSFETTTMPPECFAGVTGNFDGQGLSYGALQWNLGQGTLQPLIRDVLSDCPSVCEAIFHENLPVVESLLQAPLADQLELANSIQTALKWKVNEPWAGMLKALGRTPEFQDVQTRYAGKLFDRALAMCADFGLTTERGAALMFDICVQNGSISSAVRAQILADFAGFAPAAAAQLEMEKMRSIARRRAAACKPQFSNDVLIRKLTIAEGRGVVHGLPYDLAEQFGLRLEPFDLAAATTAS